MKIFAIEASGPVAGCALLEDGELIAEYSLQYKKKHAQSLVPMMQEMKEMTELDLKTVDAIAITKGPGSFTGLRIGAATAKGMGLALEKPIIPVPTVDALAYNLFGVQGLICPIMDARRGQVYTGLYRYEDMLVTVLAQHVGALSNMIRLLNHSGERVTFVGDAVPVYEKELTEQLTVPFSFAPPHMSRQRAGTVAALAWDCWQEQGEECMVSADDFRPEYLRLSQAEREHGDRRNFSLV